MTRSRTALLAYVVLLAAVLALPLPSGPPEGGVARPAAAGSLTPSRGERTRGMVVDEPDAGAPITNYHATWAVIIGIDSYAGGPSGLEPLLFAENDAREVRDILRDEFGYSEDHIHYLADRDATQVAVRQTFTDWLPSRDLNPDDAVLVFFAGHGLTDAHTRQGYIAAVDSRAADPGAACVSVSWLRDRVGELPCRHKVIILDSCYSGSLFAAETTPKSPADPRRRRRRGTRPAQRGSGFAAGGDPLSYYLRQPTFLGMSAGRFTPVADGLGSSRHSVFTSALLQVLRERADSPRKDHAFTFRQLAAQVETRVANALDSRQVPDWGRLGEGDGDFVLRPTLRRRTPSERAREQERMAQRGKFALALKSVETLAETDPERALEALEDADRCPLELRDFAWRFQHRLCKRDRLTLTLPARAVAWSPAGGVLAVGGAGVTLFDAASGRKGMALEDDGWAVNAVRFSPDQRTLAAARNDGTVQLWDVTTGGRSAALTGHKGPVHAVAFSPDGQSLASAGQDGTVRVWDVAQSKERVPSLKLDGGVYAVAFSPDGVLLAAANGLTAPGASPSVHVWNWAARQERWAFAGGSVFQIPTADSLAFSPDGKSLVAHGDFMMIWDLQTGKSRRAAPDLKGDANTAAYAPGGEILALGNFDGVLTMVDATGRKAAEYRGPTNTTLRGLAFAPDGKAVAGVYQSVYPNTPTVVKVWNLDPAPTRARPEGDDVWTVALSPDGRFLATGGGENGGVRLWDAVTGKAVGDFDGKHRGMVRAAAFSPDGRLLATSGDAGAATNHEIKVWDVAGRREKMTLVPRSQAWKLAFSPDGTALATTSVTTTVWDLQTGAARAEIPAGASTPVFAPDGKALILAETNGRLALWDPRTGRQTVVLQKPSATGRVDLAAFSPDGATLATAGLRSVRLWDVTTGEEQATLAETPEPVSALAFSSDGKTLAVGGEDGSVRLCDPATGQERVLLKAFSEPVRQLVFFDGDDRLAACGLKGETVVWQAAPASEPVRLRHVGPVSALAFAPDGKTLWAGSNDPKFQPGVLRGWDLDSGRVQQSFEAHRLGVTGLAAAPDGETVASGGAGMNLTLAPVSAEVVVWDAADGKRRASLQAPRQVFNGGAVVAFPAAGGPLAVGWGDEGVGGNKPWGELRVWDVQAGGDRLLFAADQPVRSLAFSPDGGRLAAGLADGTIHLWDVKAAKERAVLTGAASRAQTLAFSPDGKRLAAAGSDGTLRFWDAETSKLNAVRSGAGNVTALAFAPDGKTLATGQADGTVVLRDATTGAEWTTLTGHTQAVACLAYSPDGGLLASGGRDQVILLWRTDAVEPESRTGQAP